MQFRAAWCRLGGQAAGRRLQRPAGLTETEQLILAPSGQHAGPFCGAGQAAHCSACLLWLRAQLYLLPRASAAPGAARRPGRAGPEITAPRPRPPRLRRAGVRSPPSACLAPARLDTPAARCRPGHCRQSRTAGGPTAYPTTVSAPQSALPDAPVGRQEAGAARERDAPRSGTERTERPASFCPATRRERRNAGTPVHGPWPCASPLCPACPATHPAVVMGTCHAMQSQCCAAY